MTLSMRPHGICRRPIAGSFQSTSSSTREMRRRMQLHPFARLLRNSNGNRATEDGPKCAAEGVELMNKKYLLGSLALATLVAGAGARAADYPMVGGSAMYPSRNIVENAMNSNDHTTLVAAVKAGGLVQTLEGPGPFPVFAPTNEAFAALPAGTVDSLLKPQNKAMLDKILTYHIVPGRLDAGALQRQIAAGGGKAKLKTVEGEWLTVTQNSEGLWVTDDKGNMAKVTISDVYQSNGVILVVDKVLMPN
jgi:uncharacterized surface protein with fasciclin (FAS1) repeats